MRKCSATLYDVVGSVKGHLYCAGCEQLVLVLTYQSLCCFFPSSRPRLAAWNPAVESGSTRQSLGSPWFRPSLKFNAAIARGSKAPNQPDDELASPGWPPGCLACEPAVRTLLHYAASNTYAQPTCARRPLSPPRVLCGISNALHGAPLRILATAGILSPLRSDNQRTMVLPAC